METETQTDKIVKGDAEDSANGQWIDYEKGTVWSGATKMNI